MRTGKLYQFNNPTASSTGDGNTAIWEYTNQAEVYYLNTDIEFVADVECRLSRTAP